MGRRWIVVFLYLLCAPAFADPPEKQSSSEPMIPVIDLQDGASTAEEALQLYLKASQSFDHEAALQMVDPPIRNLLIPEIAMERYSFDEILLEHALFGPDPKFRGGMSFLFAQRDLINTREIETLDSRKVDDNRVVYTILTTEDSYHEDKTNHIVRQMLVNRRDGRWYVFRPFGALYSLLNSQERPQGEEHLVDARRNSTESPNRRNADYEEIYSIPIETVHQGLVRAAESEAATSSVVIASKLSRHFQSVWNRAKAGKITSREMLHKELSLQNAVGEKLIEMRWNALSPELLKFYQTPSKTD